MQLIDTTASFSFMTFCGDEKPWGLNLELFTDRQMLYH